MSLSRLASLSLIAGAGCGLLSSASAQGLEIPGMNTVTLDHPGSYVFGDASAVVLGQLSPDAVPDAVVLHNTNQLMLVAGADRRNSWVLIAGQHTSIALLPEALSPTRDGILSVGAGGLLKHVWDDSPNLRTLIPQGINGTSAWIGARDLQVLEDADGKYEVMALSANGKNILRARWTPGSASLANLTEIPIGTAAVSLRGLQFDGDLAFEYAVSNAAGLRIFEVTGNPPALTLSEANSGSMLLAVPAQVDGDPDSLAWIRAGGGLSDFLTLVQPGGGQTPPVWFGGLNAQQMALADVGSDARKELIVLFENFAFGFGVRRSTLDDTFLGSNPFLLDLERGKSVRGTELDYPAGSGPYGAPFAPGKAPVPAVLDMDGDGDDDIFYAGHSGANLANRALVYFGTVVDEERVLTTYKEHVRAWVPSYTYSHASSSDMGLLDIEVSPAPLVGPSKLATHFQVIVWTQTSGSPAMNPIPVDFVRVPLSTDWVHVDVPQLGQLGQPGTQDEIHLEFSFLILDAQGEMVQAFPAYHETIERSVYDLSDVDYIFLDEAWTLFQNDGVTGGTPARPPVTPPSGGGGQTIPPQ